MSDFQVARRQKQEPGIVLFGRVLVAFALFVGGVVMIGIGATDEVQLPWAWFVGGILAFGLSYGLPMRTAGRS
ncbi:hypothetical protein DNL40_09485 [Xylanimonas oleitrophica]|uniref:Uncharacterized protein n=1 Tax=Xylanimonas oleitrophica TaxID=2607479 RepID=A0A2W5WY45_9MICO|nr:hypothetical protein [Xylanimonas oleitrophica]PZR53206.1 hypothetical protein DNL40_09485 [Xylanimonas oleitrophica]